MLTDIFARRYQDVCLWDDFDESVRRLLVQGFCIVSEQLFPYYEDGREAPGAKELWDGLNKQLAMELGLEALSSQATAYPITLQGTTTRRAGFHPTVTVCRNFVCADYDGSVSADRFVKERLSFIEIAFRRKEEKIADLTARLDQENGQAEQRHNQESAEALSWQPAARGAEATRELMALRQLFGSDGVNNEKQSFRESCDELNMRFKQARAKIDYHNGFIQISPDELSTDQIGRPFWGLVSARKWGNVDHDMKEAIDRRDNVDRDPALYAAKALESTIKIISDEKGWTTGEEKGAGNYLDHLRSKKNLITHQPQPI